MSEKRFLELENDGEGVEGLLVAIGMMTVTLSALFAWIYWYPTIYELTIEQVPWYALAVIAVLAAIGGLAVFRYDGPEWLQVISAAYIFSFILTTVVVAVNVAAEFVTPVLRDIVKNAPSLTPSIWIIIGLATGIILIGAGFSVPHIRGNK